MGSVLTNCHTDPYGNYLCQKLVENCSEQQRMAVVQLVAPHMVEVALNPHGTRALQKMIEYVSDLTHIEVMVRALRGHVVPLIKDANGNHVVQKCLNRLHPPENQFIYDAVVERCVEVSTHRNGCCVLQRCVDHASPEQKVPLPSLLRRCVCAHTAV